MDRLDHEAPPPAYDAVEKTHDTDPVHSAENEKPDRVPIEATDSNASELLTNKPNGQVASSNKPLTAAFAFGPRSIFYIASWSQTFWSAPPGIKDTEIELPLSVAFGENSSYFIAGIHSSGSPSWSYAAATSKAMQSEAQKRFSQWTSALPLALDSLARTAVSFGPSNSYYASASHSTISHALPPDLQSLLESRFTAKSQRPKRLTLGVTGAYIVLWPDNTMSFNLRNHYPSAQKALSAGLTPAYVALSAWSPVGYYIEAADGFISYSLPNANNATLGRVTKFTCAMMQERASKDGSEWSFTLKSGSVERKMVVSRETKHVLDVEKVNEDIEKEKGSRGEGVKEGVGKKKHGLGTVLLVGLACAACSVM